MPYLIDGHNVIGYLPDISLDDPNDEAKLVQKLAGFAARTKKQCVVVFDSGLPAGKSRMSSTVVKVVFASHHSNADRLIMARIQHIPDPTNWTVVSSDHQVQTAARQRGIKTLSSVDFASLLQAPTPPPDHDPGEADEVRQTDEEINYWLREFTDTEDPD
ncbi:MAG: NYN domain-containing protein [Anaerolineaceae bacterium]|nr:NYN domain-containing protein [Anaerolineaceae bacterium]